MSIVLTVSELISQCLAKPNNREEAELVKRISIAVAEKFSSVELVPKTPFEREIERACRRPDSPVVELGRSAESTQAKYRQIIRSIVKASLQEGRPIVFMGHQFTRYE